VTDAWPIPLAAPPGAWALWLTVVALAVLLALLVAWLRRWLLRPMRHRETSTTDAWAEAGRRFREADAAQEDEASAGGNGDSV
jgi:F0F1-type ATP synthase membrane subunit b/b'